MLQPQTDPELAQIVLGNDLNKLQEILRLRHKQRAELLRRKDEEMVDSSCIDIPSYCLDFIFYRIIYLYHYYLSI